MARAASHRRASNGWSLITQSCTKVTGFRSPEESQGAEDTPHDLRHTCASLAVSAGVNVLALQRMLGHTSAKMTLDTYADLFDDDLDAVAVTLHARYSPESVPKMCPPRAQAA
jgi:site-specific recombinase XerD